MRILIYLVLSVFILSCSSKKYNQEIAPPFHKISIAPAKFVVDPSKDTLLNFTDGSSITIPANAFVNSNGDTVKGNVELQYKQFNNAADIIASGIPMTFEGENGEAGQMESAGMFELRGNVNNEEVFIVEGKKLNVNMGSNVKGEFDFFYLEEEDKKTASTGFIPSAYAQDQKANIKKVKWTRLTNNTGKPEEEVKDEKFFQLKFDTAQYPETKYLQTIQWKPWNDSANMNPLNNKYAWALNEKWEIMEFSKTSLPLKLVHEVKLSGNKDNHAHLGSLIDSSSFILYDGNPSIWNFQGKKKADLKGIPYLNFFGPAEMPSNYFQDRIILQNKEDEYVLWTTDGKELLNLGKTSSVSFFDEGKRILVSSFLNEETKYNLRLLDKNGKELFQKTFLLKEPFYFNLTSISSDNKTFAIHINGEIYVFNSEGKVLKTIKTNVVFNFGCRHVAYHNAILFENDSNQSKIWDWENDKIYSIPGSAFDKYNHYTPQNGKQELKPLILANNNEEIFLWNWETQKKIVLRKGKDYQYTRPGFISGNLIFVHTEFESQSERSLESIYDLNGKLILENIDGQSSNLNNQVLVRKGKDFLWLDQKGILIKNFTKFDSTIVNLFFIDKKDVATLSKSGTVCFWDQKGKLYKTFNINLGQNDRLKWLHQINNLIIGQSLQNLKIWDMNGTFIGFIDANIYTVVFSSGYQLAAITGNGQYLEFLEIGKEKVAEGVYQILLKSKERSFHTYVRLGRKEMEAIEKYTEGKDKKLMQEQKREEKEKTVLRSFEISRFGIYNWDRIYKEENVIQLVADFDFGNKVTIYNENLNVFLISGVDQNIVVKYPKDTWDKFSYDPAIPNRLLAVLPDDQIAVFDPKDFEVLNKELLKKNGKFTFKMKVLGKLESMEALNSILKKPEKPV